MTDHVSASTIQRAVRSARSRAVIAMLVGAMLAFGSISTAVAATVSRSLVAGIGYRGGNGTATLRLFTNGSGSVYTRGHGLEHGTVYRQALYKGSCAHPGTRILTLSSAQTTSGGKISHTARLTTAGASRVRAALRHGGKVSIRIWTGSATRCGTLKAATGGSGSSGSSGGGPGSSTGLPDFSHIYVLVMENREYSSIVGSSNAPYLNGLIAQYGLATNYNAVTHPSEPNYFALFSGSTQGVTNDSRYDLAGTNLVDQLTAKQRSWRVFAQNVPLGCYTGMTASGGPDGSGSYVRKHEPAISFTDISTDAARCADIANFSAFDPSAADFEMIVPNLCNDMHDCSVAAGDAFLQGFVPKITSSASFKAGGVLFITWDEGTSDIGGGGHVATLVIGPGAKTGFTSSVAHDHYSLVRTIEDAWGLGCLNQTCSANDLSEFFP
jgi:phosphatidylinositol-3-phosphatase